MNSNSYHAMQATRPGVLEWVERPLLAPGPGQVRIRVEACGVCHTDAWTVDGGVVDVAYPRVPGHEIVGRIEALGDGVGGWKTGQRVGLGFLGGPCGRCDACRRGEFAFCGDQRWTGIHHDGGYAEVVTAAASGLVPIPDSLGAIEAAPLLCAGVTVFKALKKSGIAPGRTAAIQGLGGLGHLAVQFARKMGLRTVAIARGADKAALALELGAHHYIDSAATDAAQALTELGGADVILSTVTRPASASSLIPGLALHGRLVVLGLGAEPIEVSPFALVPRDVSVQGSLTGSTFDSEEALAFSALQHIRTRIQTMPLADARLAYDKMMRNEARFRIVLIPGGQA